MSWLRWLIDCALIAAGEIWERCARAPTGPPTTDQARETLRVLDAVDELDRAHDLPALDADALALIEVVRGRCAALIALDDEIDHYMAGEPEGVGRAVIWAELAPQVWADEDGES